MDNTTLQQVAFFVPYSKVLQDLSAIIREEIKADLTKELQEKFLSPAETCKMFSPKISIGTLANWAEQGHVRKHFIGGRTYFKYSEIIESVKHLEKYKKPVVATN